MYDDLFFIKYLVKNSTTIIGVLQEHVEPVTLIITVYWRGYVNFEELGYIHQTVNIQEISSIQKQEKIHRPFENDWCVHKRTFRG